MGGGGGGGGGGSWARRGDAWSVRQQRAMLGRAVRSMRGTIGGKHDDDMFDVSLKGVPKQTIASVVIFV